MLTSTSISRPPIQPIPTTKEPGNQQPQFWFGLIGIIRSLNYKVPDIDALNATYHNTPYNSVTVYYIPFFAFKLCNPGSAAISALIINDLKRALLRHEIIELGCFKHHLTHWGWDKMTAILQTAVSKVFSWTKMYEVRLKCHWSLLLRVQLTIFKHWFR